jgi:hypothetical protein
MIYQKTSKNSRSVFNAGKLLTGINAKMNELSGDMQLVAEHSVFEEIFSIYPMGSLGLPWVSDFSMGFSWATHAKLYLKCKFHEILVKFNENLIFIF